MPNQATLTTAEAIRAGIEKRANLIRSTRFRAADPNETRRRIEAKARLLAESRRLSPAGFRPDTPAPPPQPRGAAVFADTGSPVAGFEPPVAGAVPDMLAADQRRIEGQRRADEIRRIIEPSVAPMPGEPERARAMRVQNTVRELAAREGINIPPVPDSMPVPAIAPWRGNGPIDQENLPPDEAVLRSLVRGGLMLGTTASGLAQAAGESGVSAVFAPSVPPAMVSQGAETVGDFARESASLGAPPSTSVTNGEAGIGRTILERAPEGVVAMGPLVPAGIVGGPALAAGAMGLMGAGQQYGESRDMGRSPAQAAADATVQGIIDTAFGAIPAKALFGVGTGAGGLLRRVVNNAVSMAGANAGQRVATAVAREANGIDPQAWERLPEEMKAGFIVDMAVGALFGAAVKPHAGHGRSAGEAGEAEVRNSAGTRVENAGNSAQESGTITDAARTTDPATDARVDALSRSWDRMTRTDTKADANAGAGGSVNEEPAGISGASDRRDDPLGFPATAGSVDPRPSAVDNIEGAASAPAKPSPAAKRGRPSTGVQLDPETLAILDRIEAEARSGAPRLTRKPARAIDPAAESAPIGRSSETTSKPGKSEEGPSASPAVDGPGGSSRSPAYNGPSPDGMSAWSVKTLRTEARSRGYTGPMPTKKSDLLRLVRSMEAPQPPQEATTDPLARPTPKPIASDQPTTRPTTGARLEAFAERVEENAQARRRASAEQVAQVRTKGKGRSLGAAPILPELVNVAVIAAARAVRQGVRGGRRLRTIVRELTGALPKSLGDQERAVTGLVRSLLRHSTRADGSLDRAAFEEAVTRARAEATAARPAQQPLEHAGDNASPQPTQDSAPLGDEPVKGNEPPSRRNERGRRSELGPSDAPDAGLKQAQADAPNGDTPPPTTKARGVEVSVRAARRAAREATETRRSEALTGARAVYQKARELVAASDAPADVTPRLIEAAADLPRPLRESFVAAVTTADSPAALRLAVERADIQTAQRLGRDAQRDIERLTAPGALARLTEARREEALRNLVEAQPLARNLARGKPSAQRARDLADGLKSRAMRLRELESEQRAETTVVFEGRRRRVEEVVNLAAARLDRRKDASADTDGVPKRSRVGRVYDAMLIPENRAMRLDSDYSGDGPFTEMLYRRPGELTENRFQHVFRVSAATERIVKAAGFRSLGDALYRLSGTAGRASQEMLPFRVSGLRLSMGEALKIHAMRTDAATRKLIDAGTPLVLERYKDRPFVLSERDAARIDNAIPQSRRDMVSGIKALRERELRAPLFATIRRMLGHEPQAQEGYEPRQRYIRTDRIEAAPRSYTGELRSLLENSGIVQERSPSTKAPILVSDFLNDHLSHVERATAIIHLAEWARDALTVLRSEPVRSRLAAKFGAGRGGSSWMLDRLESHVFDTALSETHTETWADKVARVLASNTSRAAVAINPRSWGKNLGGVFKVLADTDAKDWIGAASALKPSHFRRLTTDSATMHYRYAGAPHSIFSQVEPGATVFDDAGFVRSLGAVAKAAVPGMGGGAGKAFDRALDQIKVSNFFDSVPARVAYGIHLREAARLHPQWSQQRRRVWAARRVTDTFRRTQNTGSALDSSHFSRLGRKSAIIRVLTPFTSDASKGFNMLDRALHTSPTAALKASIGLALNALWSGAVVYGVGKGADAVRTELGREDSEKDSEKREARVMADAARTFFGDLFGAASGGYMGNVYDLAASLMQKGDTGRWAAFENPAADALGNLIEGMGRAAVAIMEDSEDLPEHKREKAVQRFHRAVEQAALGAAASRGIPVGPVYRIGRDIAREDSR
jgi:hypothetical protein